MSSVSNPANLQAKTLGEPLSYHCPSLTILLAADVFERIGVDTGTMCAYRAYNAIDLHTNGLSLEVAVADDRRHVLLRTELGFSSRSTRSLRQAW